MTTKTATIICGAPCRGIKKEDVQGLVIAADRGLDYAKAAGITPDIAVGDFDSAESAPPEGMECVRVSPIKDNTDANLAADIAIERGCCELRFLAALGGRLDHTLANIQMMYGLLEQGIKAELYGERERACFVRGETAVIPQFDGYLSVFAFGGEAEVSEEGTKYPAERITLRESFPLGVSNEITAPQARITVHRGTALVIEQYERQDNCRD